MIEKGKKKNNNNNKNKNKKKKTRKNISTLSDMGSAVVKHIRKCQQQRRRQQQQQQQQQQQYSFNVSVDLPAPVRGHVTRECVVRSLSIAYVNVFSVTIAPCPDVPTQLFNINPPCVHLAMFTYVRLHTMQ